MGNKNVTKDKKKSKKDKKKSKKAKSKKHMKEKLLKRKKKSNFKDNSSDSASSSSSNSDSEVTLTNETGKKNSNALEWGFLDTVLSDSFVTVKNKTEKSKKPVSESPGQNIRELNPYWKDGGCGLPPVETERKYEVNIESSGQNSSTSTYLDRYLYNKNKYGSQAECSSDRKKLNFLKPDEKSEVQIRQNIFKGNWKKKEVKAPEVTESRIETSKSNKDENPTQSSTTAVSSEDLNKLAAKLVKAEIMGNTALINKLKLELEAAKKTRNEASDSASKTKGRSEEVIIMTDRTSKMTSESRESCPASKRQKLATHDSGQRICYFADDNKYSLKNLFEKEKGTSEEDIMLPSKLGAKNLSDIDDMCLEAAASSKMQGKMEEVKKQKERKEAVAKHKALEGCPWCLDNRNTTKHLIMSIGSKCYLCLPEQQSLTEGHCLLVPLQHEISMMQVGEDVWNEIRTYQNVLTKMFLEKDQDVIFFENARSFKHYPHCVIQCVPLSKEMGSLAPIYFQKAISESETEWSNNKKLIDFRQKDLRRSIPKDLPYFAVTFGTSGGFAHIIEDEYLFKRNFAEEVLGGMMDLDHTKWRKQQRDNFGMQRQKAMNFLKMWKKFEFNEKKSDSESSTSD